MTLHAPRLPISFHPLIAEAKRRMRRRRLLIVALVVLLAGGAAGGTVAFSGPTSSAGRQSPAAAPPGPAVRLAMCSIFHHVPGCRSPDGAWTMLMPGNGSSCDIVLRRGTGRFERAFDSAAGGCGGAVWVKPHLLLFGVGGLGNAYRVMSLDPASGKVTPVANFLNFVVSANKGWIAGELRPKGAPPLVAAVSLRNRECRVVTQARGASENVVVAAGDRVGMLGGDGVSWRHVSIRHTKVNVAAGPGVGFTRNSRGVIVAVNHWSNETEAYHRDLVRFPLSKLRTPCPAVVTAASAKASALGAWPGPHFKHTAARFSPLTLRFRRSGHRLASVRVIVNGPISDATMRVSVLRGDPYGPSSGRSVVFEEQVPMTILPGHGDVPAGSFPRATWTGTLSASDWRGGCRDAQYEVSVQIRPSTPTSTPQGEGLGSPWFRCRSG